MNYSAARKKIKSGQLLAWGHERWGSWYDLKIQAVRMWERSVYCHVGIAWWAGVERDRLLVFEAVLTGVRVFPLSRMLPFYWCPNPVNWTSEVETWALRQVGEPYSQWQAIKAGLGLLKRGEDSIWQCAELAQELLSRQGMWVYGEPTPNNVMLQAQRRYAGIEFVEQDVPSQTQRKEPQ